MRMADVIRTRRVELGFSPTELEARAGIGAGQVADFEQADGLEPTREAAVLIAQALGLSLEELTADDAERLRSRWFIETALRIAVETDGVETIGWTDDGQQSTIFLPREPSDTVRRRLRRLGADYGFDIDVRLDPDASPSP
jgi:transcriptional regulator with XRE-family HTH domain